MTDPNPKGTRPDKLNRRIYQPGEVIFHAGDPGDCAYLIERGRVEVVLNDHGVERRLGLLGQGELFGEIALVDRFPRTATVRSLEVTELVIIERNIVNQLLEKTDPVIRLIIDIILRRWRSAIGSSHTAPVEHSRHQQAVRNLVLSSEIKRALDLGQFVLHYQPIIRLKDQKVAGFEALIRWQDPDRGLLPPGEFLALSEQNGQIREIGLWTLEQSSRDWPRLRQLTATDSPFVSVNVSATQLDDPTFGDAVKRILQRHRMEPQHLKLELTETALVAERDIAHALLSELHESGIAWAMDDFGTGYSSLSSLQNYPIGTLKVDRSFVGQMLFSSLSMQIVMNTLVLAHNLGIDVVAEGVETPETFDLLRQLGCEYGQGWLFGKPQPLEILERGLPA